MRETQRGPGSRPALSRLISSSPQVFSSEYWGNIPLVSTRAQLEEDFSDLFSLEAVDELVAERALRTPFVRMAKEGAVLPPVEFTSGGGYGAEIADQLDADKVLAAFADGSTLVLQGLHRTWPALADFIRQLNVDLGYPCQVNAYITPASSRGFDPHYDVHDVFVIQIHGEKSWTIHEPVYVDPLSSQPWSERRSAVAEQAQGVPHLEHTFAPGDVLYLPRGWIHSATALGDTSIHLTIGIAPHTRYEIVEQALERLRTDATLRQSLPMRPTTDAVSNEPVPGNAVHEETVPDNAVQTGALAANDARSLVEEVLARAAEELRDETFVNDVAARFADRSGPAAGGAFAGVAAPAPVRPLATIAAAAELNADTVVSWRPGLSARLALDDTTVGIVTASKTVSLPAEASRAVEALHHGTSCHGGALPGLDAASSLVVARRLIREGVLVVA